MLILLILCIFGSFITDINCNPIKYYGYQVITFGLIDYSEITCILNVTRTGFIPLSECSGLSYVGLNGTYELAIQEEIFTVSDYFYFTHSALNLKSNYIFRHGEFISFDGVLWPPQTKTIVSDNFKFSCDYYFLEEEMPKEICNLLEFHATVSQDNDNLFEINGFITLTDNITLINGTFTNNYLNKYNYSMLIENLWWKGLSNQFNYYFYNPDHGYYPLIIKRNDEMIAVSIGDLFYGNKTLNKIGPMNVGSANIDINRNNNGITTRYQYKCRNLIDKDELTSGSLDIPSMELFRVFNFEVKTNDDLFEATLALQEYGHGFDIGLNVINYISKSSEYRNPQFFTYIGSFSDNVPIGTSNLKNIRFSISVLFENKERTLKETKCITLSDGIIGDCTGAYLTSEDDLCITSDLTLCASDYQRYISPVPMISPTKIYMKHEASLIGNDMISFNTQAELKNNEIIVTFEGSQPPKEIFWKGVPLQQTSLKNYTLSPIKNGIGVLNAYYDTIIPVGVFHFYEYKLMKTPTIPFRFNDESFQYHFSGNYNNNTFNYDVDVFPTNFQRYNYDISSIEWPTTNPSKKTNYRRSKSGFHLLIFLRSISLLSAGTPL